MASFVVFNSRDMLVNVALLAVQTKGFHNAGNVVHVSQVLHYRLITDSHRFLLNLPELVDSFYLLAKCVHDEDVFRVIGDIPVNFFKVLCFDMRAILLK
jgi:hypothetical protein